MSPALLLGKGTLGLIGKAELPESRGKKEEKNPPAWVVPGLGDYSRHSALPSPQGRGANVFFCVHLDLVSLWFLPELLCLHLVGGMEV